MEATPHPTGSLEAFLSILPDGIVRALTVLSAAVSLTDEVATTLINQCAFSEFEAVSIIRCLRASDFIVERNSEWHFEPSARATLLDQLYKEQELARAAHSVLQRLTQEADSAFAGDSVPTYLTWPVGRAYHTTLFDSDEGLDLYKEAFTGRPTGDQWLLGVLAEEQQKAGLLPSTLIAPSYFRGMIAYRERQWREAEGYFRKVVESREISQEVATALHLLGIILHRRHRDKDAEKLMRRSLEMEEHLGDSHSQAKVLHSLGNLLGRRKLKESIEHLRRSLELLSLKGREDLRGQAQVLQSLGNLLGSQRKNKKKAEEMLRRSLKIERRLSNQHGQAQVMHNLANLVAQSNFTEAETLFRNSLKLLEQVGDLYGQAQVLHSWGKVVKSRDLERAETLLRRSLSLGEKIRNLDHQVQVLNSLGDVSRQRKQWTNAREHYQRVIDLNRDPRSVSTAHVGLSYVSQQHEKDIKSAIEHMREAISLIRRTNRRDLVKKDAARLKNLERQYPDDKAS